MATPGRSNDGASDLLGQCTADIAAWSRFEKKSPRFKTMAERCPGITKDSPLTGDQRCFEPLRETYTRFSTFRVDFKKLVKRAKDGHTNANLAKLRDQGDINYRDLFARIDIYYAALGRGNHARTPFPNGASFSSQFDAAVHQKYLAASNRLCIVCGEKAAQCEQQGSSMPPGVERTSVRHQYLRQLPAIAADECSKVNLKHYALVAELYLMGSGLPSDDARCFLAWAEQNNLAKHFAKQAALLKALLHEFLRDIREQGNGLGGACEPCMEPKEIVRRCAACKFGQLTHSELCFMECALRHSGIKRERYWDLMYECVAKLLVLNVQVLDRGNWCMEAVARDVLAASLPPPNSPVDSLQRHMIASLGMQMPF